MKKLTLEQKLLLNGSRPDEESHLKIIDPEKLGGEGACLLPDRN
jgi:hypothetical protein